MEEIKNNISGVYVLHHNTTFTVENDTWEIQTKYTDSNKLILINKTTGQYISALFRLKKYPDLLNFDYQDNMYFFDVDDSNVYIEFLNKKVRRK